MDEYKQFIYKFKCLFFTLRDDNLYRERYVYEFAIMGGIITTFEVLRVDEMKNKDKTQAFYFLYRLIDGQGGARLKHLICSDTSCKFHKYLLFCLLFTE